MRGQHSSRGWSFYYSPAASLWRQLSKRSASTWKALRWGGAEIKLRAARKEAEAVAAEQGKPLGDQLSPPSEEFLRRAEDNPAIAVLDIWKELETAVFKFQQDNNVRWTTVTGFMRTLRDFDKLTGREYRLFETLRSIRNAVVHSHDRMPITVAEVIEYRSFVAALIARLEQVKVEAAGTDGLALK